MQTKRKLLDDCDLWCIVSLPPGTFVNAGAGVKANLLFFTKGEPTAKIWYYDLATIKVGKRNPLTLAHFDEFFRLLHERADSEHSWTVLPQEIEAKHYDLKTVHILLASETGHATPKIDVRGVVFSDDMILLVKERQDGLWTLPGGWADVNESPGEAVVREVFEESGYQTRAVKLLALYDRRQHAHPPHLYHIYKLFFRCEILGGAPAPSVETEEVGFFRENVLPELSIMRVTPGQIARLFEHYRHPDWPTDFD